ncbi:MAG: hypothetical protein JWQ94_575 [Tardiphaga sp.]|jgi:hypothetical protein|nr:hypothetical protein [Tardiphaga sp.]
MNEAFRTDIIGAAMWQLVERYTGKIGYKGGVKAEGLALTPPVIDCSGWTSLLLSTAMKAANAAAEQDIFGSEDIRAISTWSDRLIQEIETRWGNVIEGDRIAGDALPRYATIGLRQGGGAWAANHPRPRGITHVVQIVRRPGDDAPFVTESQGWARPFGLRLLPLSDWLNTTERYLKVGEAWAVDAFAATSVAGGSVSR